MISKDQSKDASDSTAVELPLAGVRIIEMAGLGPVPYAGQLLSDMGAEVISVARPQQASHQVEDRGKRSMVMDLKNPQALDALLQLIDTGDILIEGYRPGVAERLGFGPELCLERVPHLVYARMTGWGQKGPWSQMAGHDINYIGLTGVLHAIGTQEDVPPPPLNLLGDYAGGSMFLVAGVLAALYAAQKNGRGDIIDVAMIDGAISLFGLMLSMHAEGRWSTDRSSNMLDGAMPYYRCYRCQDNRFVAVGALESAFFDQMLVKLNIDSADYGDREDTTQYARQHALLESCFATRERDDWARVFDGSDACVTPVLDFLEASNHPHVKYRQSLVKHAGITQSNLAPRFSNFENVSATTVSRGADTEAVLQELQLPADLIDSLS